MRSFMVEIFQQCSNSPLIEKMTKIDVENRRLRFIIGDMIHTTLLEESDQCVNNNGLPPPLLGFE